MITITEEHLRELKTKRGGYTNATLHALGVSPKNNKGWRRRLVGKTFTDEQYQTALEGRFKRAGKKHQPDRVDKKHQPDTICIDGKWYRLVKID